MPWHHTVWPPKRSYKIRLDEKDISHAVTEAWPELVRYQDNYYCLLEDYNVLKESIRSAKAKAEECRAKMTQLYDKLDSRRVTIQNLGDQVQSLEKQLQETKDNSAELSSNKDLILENKHLILENKHLILENKHLKQELEYYVGRVRYALYGKDLAWADHNGYHITDIPALDEEDNDEDQAGLPTIPEDIPQNIPLIPPTKHARPVSKTIQNNTKVIRDAGIPAIGGFHLPPKQKRIITDPPTSITGILPKPLGKARAEQWDQPALRGTSEWIMEHDIHDSEMCRLYIEGKALQPHEQSPDHTAAMFRIDEYARLLPGIPRNLVPRHNNPDWMTEVIQTFNMNPSAPKYHGAEAETLLQSIFSTVGRWDQLVTGQWKRNDSPFLCSPAPARYTIHHNQKLDRGTFAYWLDCEAGVTPSLAREKLEPYFVCHATKMIWNEVTLPSQFRANKIASLKGGTMNQFCVHDDLLPLVWESPFYSPPSVGEPMDQDESDPEPTPIQPTAGSSSLANRLDYGEGGSFSRPPVDTRELRACISYYDSLVPQGTAHESTAELTEELTRDLYVDNLE
ncbi:hypothetical protein M422DRAFT_253943 [Sphaerobolus stellatus SS14]|uniref:Uncharacterized protein n=1 Tax=Sphaerobolus stellatus (strain SS14) TaxID=990650 RepID=A0A0C9V778_SPHS4|nr:hypothetical protein M422DRAFT_253943 [Sphaerobolus stellatus SS14]